MQATECYRKLFTDDANDFDSFVMRYNPIIWAYGTIANGVMQHHFPAADLLDAIYLEGDVGYFDETTDDDTKDNNYIIDRWMIMAIIFIGLSIILLLIAAILCLKAKHSPRSSGYIDSSALTEDDGRPNPTEDVIVSCEAKDTTTNEKDDSL